MVTIEPLIIQQNTLNEVKHLFTLFKNNTIQPHQWKTLFSPPWLKQNPHRGYVLKDKKRVVGMLITINSKRNINNTSVSFCNLSSWVVLPEYRKQGLSLILDTLNKPNNVVTNFSPSPDVYFILKKFGFKDLETHLCLLLSWPLPNLRNRYTLSEEKALETLTGVHKEIFNDHQLETCKHLVIKKR